MFFSLEFTSFYWNFYIDHLVCNILSKRYFNHVCPKDFLKINRYVNYCALIVGIYDFLVPFTHKPFHKWLQFFHHLRKSVFIECMSSSLSFGLPNCSAFREKERFSKQLLHHSVNVTRFFCKTILCSEKLADKVWIRDVDFNASEHVPNNNRVLFGTVTSVKSASIKLIVYHKQRWMFHHSLAFTSFLNHFRNVSQISDYETSWTRQNCHSLSSIEPYS